MAKRFRHDISLVKNGVSTCFGLDGTLAIAKYKASSAALVNNLDKEHELADKAEVILEQAYDLYEAELKQNRCDDLHCVQQQTPCCLMFLWHCTQEASAWLTTSISNRYSLVVTSRKQSMSTLLPQSQSPLSGKNDK